MGVANVALGEHLRVGLQAIFQVDPHRQNAPRHKTRVRGWHTGAYIFLDRPKLEGAEYLTVHLQQECVVRFLTDGMAVGFRSTVLDTGFSRFHPQMSIMWPTDIISLPARSVERVAVELPCRVTLDSGLEIPAVLHNLSPSGCQLLSPEPIPLGEKLRTTCGISPEIELRQQETEVLGIDIRGEQHLIRCKFLHLTPEISAQLDMFLRSRQPSEAA